MLPACVSIIPKTNKLIFKIAFRTILLYELRVARFKNVDVDGVRDIAGVYIRCDILDYIMSKFQYDELMDGNPTVDGLRRVTELVLGQIIDMKCEIVQTPNKENEGRATVTCSVTVLVNWENNLHHRTASGSGDAWHKNTDMPYSKFPVAMAETRAEGRALRRLLQLRKIVAAEELSETANNEEQDYSEDVTNNQISFIDVMCKSVGRGLDINVEEFVKSQFPSCKTIRDLRHQQASNLIQSLSHYQQNMEQIPDAVKGYITTWKDGFDANES